MIGTVISAFISFISTNLDDIFVLMLLFSQANNKLRNWHIVSGQFLGIGFLTAVSIIGAFGVSLFPQKYIGFLGLAPIYLGIKAYHDYFKGKKSAEDDKDSYGHNIHSTIFNTADAPQNNGRFSRIKKFINPGILKVASITVANGGDNIGVYIPLFANMNLLSLIISSIIFLLLTAAWCFLGYRLSEHPLIHKYIDRYSDILIPVIFIGLGIFIIYSSL